MPEIDRERLAAKLATIPEQDKEPYLLALKAKGYTWKTSSQSAPTTTASAAKQAITETLTEDVPYLGRVAKAVRTDIPGAIAEKAGQLGMPKTGAAIGTAVGMAGELIPQKGWELATLGAAKPLGTAVKAAGATLAPPLISFLARIEKPVVTRAIARAGELGKKELLAPEAIENAIKGLGEGIKSARSALGQKLGAIEDRLASTSLVKIPVADIGLGLSKKFVNSGFSVPPIWLKFIRERPGKITSALPKEVTEILSDLGSKPLSFRDGVNLKRKIADIVDWDKSKLLGLSSKEQSFLKNAHAELNARLRVESPRYAKANAAFAKAAKVYDELAKDVLSGKPETIQRRITGMFNKGSADRKIVERVDKISRDAGTSLDTILDSIMAQKFQPVINPTVMNAATRTGGGILGAAGLGGAAGTYAAMGSPGAALAVGGALAATSPKLHALGIRAFAAPMGKATAPALARPAASAAIAALRARREKK